MTPCKCGAPRCERCGGCTASESNPEKCGAAHAAGEADAWRFSALLCRYCEECGQRPKSAGSEFCEECYQRAGIVDGTYGFSMMQVEAEAQRTKFTESGRSVVLGGRLAYVARRPGDGAERAFDAGPWYGDEVDV